MNSNYLTFSVFIVCICLVSLSSSKTIVKNLPGFDGDLPFTFETGYVGVGDDNELQFFYYFVESQRDPLHDPLLLYLTGGPGTSGLYPFLYQIGPLSINFDISTWDNVTFEVNPNSWSKTANVIYVDLPAGVGFSYATTYEASRSSDSILALNSYKFLLNWLVDHPTFYNNPLYITGISYMGMLVPIVTLETYLGNERGDQPELNIKGCMIVSPLTDKFSDFNSRFEFAHRVALISDEIYESTKETCAGNYVYNSPENSECSKSLQRVDECTSRINMANILDPFCDDVNPDPTCREAAEKYLYYWGNNKDVQKALNVREGILATLTLILGRYLLALYGTVETFEKTNETIHYDLKKNDTPSYSYDIWSSIIYHEKLISRNCQVLILNGDHDMNFPYVGTEQWIKSFNLPIESPWDPWFVNTQIAGYRMTYAKDGYALMYATVKGAGHSIPLYKPEETWFILDEWLASHSYLSDS